ncbi:MAG: spheroidene monooxygenase, partial [Chitinophagia bacterium]|nr:spheroidene monooxygenase [Chitinophagia bacterium]
MYAALTVARYPRGLFPLSILSMAWFRLPLWLDRRNRHWKLMGSGRNGSFDIRPDLDQWAVMVFRDRPFTDDGTPESGGIGLETLYGRSMPA